MSAPRASHYLYGHVPFKSAVLRHQLRRFILLLTLLSAFSASAQVLHIDTIGCRLDDSDTAYVSKMVKYQGQFYNHVFSTHKNDTAKVNIDLYGNDKAYIKALKINKFKVFTNGLYSPQLNKSFVFKSELFLHIILRATNSNILHLNYPDAPRWLTEGMASVMSNTDETGDKKIVYTPLIYYNKQIKDLTWTDQLDLNFGNIFDDNNPDWNSKGGNGMLRALSYAVACFLINGDKDNLTPVILSMKEGHSTTDAITSTFGSFDNFKNLFTVYYRYSAPSSKFQ